MFNQFYTRLFSSLLTVLLLWITSYTLWGQDARDYTQIDKHASATPKEIEHDLNKLTDYLCSKAGDDTEKVRAIYTWISQNIKYDHRTDEEETYFYNYDAKKVLEKRKGVCTGFSTLFQAMCTREGIATEVISGYSKQLSTSTKEHTKPDHSWNAVYIDDRWQLVDVTWAQGLSAGANQNSYYFLSNPYYFLVTHLPAIEMWQLIDCPISMDQFKMTQSKIDAHLDTIANCYNYKDTINNYLSLTPSMQRLYRDQHIYDLNPTDQNAVIFGHALVDYAGILVDTIEHYRLQGLSDSLTTNYQEVVNILSEAYQVTDFYPWQVELYGSSLINLALSLYQSPSATKDNQSKTDEAILQNLDKAILISEDSDSHFIKNLNEQAKKYKKDIESQLRSKK